MSTIAVTQSAVTLTVNPTTGVLTVVPTTVTLALLGGSSVVPGWYSGAGVPNPALYVDGAYYLRTTTGDVYLKALGVWSIVANITGPDGEQAVAFANAAARALAAPTFLGQVGLQRDTAVLYYGTALSAGGWTVIPVGGGGGDVTGPAGAVAGNFAALSATGKVLSDSGKTGTSFDAAGTSGAHAILTTGVHGVGGGVVAKVSDIGAIGALATLTRSIVLTFDGGGSAITATPVYLRMPFAFTPTKWTIVAGTSSSIAFSVCVDPYSTTTLPTTSVGGTAPSLTTAVAATAVPDWTDTTWADGELLKVVPTGTPTATWAVLVIEGTSVE
jgi:hypothetical protein